jgi:hypothetical protein
MESPAAALEWRVSELERVVGRRCPDDKTSPSSVVAAVALAAQSSRAAVDPTGALVQILRRARTLRDMSRHGSGLERGLGDARERVTALERGLDELTAMQGVLDGDWRHCGVLGAAVVEDVRSLRQKADELEREVHKETRAVDRVLVAYNSAVEMMNTRFEQLVSLLLELEEKRGIRPAGADAEWKGAVS